MAGQRRADTIPPRPGWGVRLGAGLLGTYLRLAARTTRWRFEAGADAWTTLRDTPSIVVFWHEALALTPSLLARLRRSEPEAGGRRPVHTLISRHRDGAIAAAIVARLDAEVVRGSASREKNGRRADRGGAAALRRMLALLRDGGHVGIAVDGPRGPARRPQAGIALLARLSGAPVVPCALATRPQIRLRGWDRMRLPVPFARGRMVVGPPLRFPSPDPSEDPSEDPSGDRGATLAAIAGAIEAARARSEAW